MGYNPYIQQDIAVIIDAFCRPSAQDNVVNPDGTQSAPSTVPYVDSHPAETMRNNIANLMNWDKQVDSNTWVAQVSDHLQKNLDEAKAAVDTLYSYGTGRNGQTGSIDTSYLSGVNFQNTIYSITKAENFGQAAATLIADCVPCEQRILALLSLNPIEDVWKALDTMYQQQVSFLLNLFDLILGDHSLQAFADFCRLFNFLSFMCLPDLARIIVMLSSLITSYSLKLKDIQITFANIIGQMFGGGFAPLVALLDKYIQLIVAPVECVITSINVELQKMNVVAAWQTATGAKGPKAKTPQIDEKKMVDAMKNPMLQLKKMLENSRDEANEKLKKIKQSILEVLGLKDKVGKNILDISGAIQQVTKMIGLVQAIILAMQNGGISCGDINQENLDNFLNNYDDKNLDIVKQGDTIKVMPKVPADISKLMEVLGSVENNRAKIANEQPRQVKVAESVIPVNNCLRSSPDPTLAATKDFVNSL